VPRYSYRCDTCKETSVLFHLADEIATDCPLCEASGALTKMLSRFSTAPKKEKSSSATAGSVTEEFIQEAREDLKIHKEGLKDKR